MEWIEQLNAAALRDYDRESSRIELTYDPAVAARVREFVRGEQECCPFLEFTIHEDENALIVTIEAPEDASEAADELFARSLAT
ncbi:MAG: hypothetical protein ACRDT5_00500 [Mycobacterium sp.]